MVLGNLLLITVIFLFGGLSNPVVFVSGIAGMAIFSSAITWVMFQVIDKY